MWGLQRPETTLDPLEFELQAIMTCGHDCWETKLTSSESSRCPRTLSPLSGRDHKVKGGEEEKEEAEKGCCHEDRHDRAEVAQAGPTWEVTHEI